MHYLGLALLTLSLMIFMGGCDGSTDVDRQPGAANRSAGASASVLHESGADSPAAAVARIAKATANNDVTGITSIMPASSDQQRADNEKVGQVLLLMNRVPQIVKDAYARFDKEQVAASLGVSGMMLEGMSRPDFSLCNGCQRGDAIHDDGDSARGSTRPSGLIPSLVRSHGRLCST